MVPNPRRFGTDAGGPSRSTQLIVKVSPSVPQQTSTRPVSIESAPYFPRWWRAREHEPDGLLNPPSSAAWALRGDTRTNEVGEGSELRADQVLDPDPIPFVPDEQVLTR